MNALAQSLGGLGGGRLATIGAVGAGLLIFFIFLTTRLSGPGAMEMLYGGLDPAQSGKIISKLEAQQIPYELKAGGTQLFVPRDKVLGLRVSMAESGTSGGIVGYEIFNDTDALGTTSFHQNINRLRALEGEMARTIKSINSVDNARVHIVLPKRQLFSREKDRPSASIVLKLNSSGRFTQVQVRAVQNIVASSVPGLTTDRVSVVDNNGNLLARTEEGDGSGATSPGDASEMRQAYEGRLAHTVETLLERTLGFGRVRAEVNAEMDFDRVVINTEEYDPEGQVVRSTQSVEESANSADNSGEQAVTVSNNLPNAQGANGGAGGGNASASSRTEETVNFEISKTIRNHIQESGTVKKLSVAVLVDGTYTENADGEKIYAPHSEEEMNQYKQLVRSAVGFDEKRGDVVSVINLQFAVVDDGFAKDTIEPLFGLNKQDYFQIAEILILSVVAILVLMMVVRPLVMRALESMPPPSAAIDDPMLTDQSDALAPSTSGQSALQAAAGGMPEALEQGEDESAEALINLQQIEGRVKASSLRKIGEIIDKHPEETVSIIRNWMFQENN